MKAKTTKRHQHETESGGKYQHRNGSMWRESSGELYLESGEKRGENIIVAHRKRSVISVSMKGMAKAAKK